MPEPQIEAAAKPRVLLIHESRIMRASITRHIKHLYDCIEYADLEAGWRALLDDASVQVVLIDIAMPREDGIPVIARITGSNIPRIANTPVVAIASAEGYPGNALDEARVRALDAGAIDFIAKATSGVETLARIGAALRVAKAQCDLEAMREKASLDMPVDPASGVMTREYLHVVREQQIAFARRHESELAILCVGVDDLEDIEARLGADLASSIGRALAGVLSRCLWREDTVAQGDDGNVFVILPGRSVAQVAELARALRGRLAGVVMRHRGELLQVTVSIGASSLLADPVPEGAQAGTYLTELAQRRMIEAREAGADQFRGATEPPPKPVEAPGPDAQTGSLDAALELLAREGAEALRPSLPKLIQRLTPLLKLFEREFQLNFRLSRLKERASRGEAVTAK